MAALGVAQTLAWASTYYLPAVLATPIAVELGVTAGTVFAAFSVALLVTALVGPLAGRCIDAFGGRNVLALSNLVIAAGLGLLAATQGNAMLFAAWAVIGVGMGLGLYEAAFSTLAGLYGSRARGAITGVALVAGFASTIGWPLSAWLDAELGWRWVCLAWAVGHVAIGLPLNRFVVPARSRETVAGTTPTAPRPAAAASMGSRPAMWLLAVVFSVTWFTSTAIAAHLPRILQESGATPAAAIAAAALVGPAQVAGRVLEFGFLQRFHVLLSARLAALAHPLGALCLIGFGAPAGAAFAGLHGAGNGVLTIANGTLPLALFGPVGYGFRQGVLMAPARLAQAGAPLVFAVLMDWSTTSALVLTTALGFAAFAALSLLTPTPETKTP